MAFQTLFKYFSNFIQIEWCIVTKTIELINCFELDGPYQLTNASSISHGCLRWQSNNNNYYEAGQDRTGHMMKLKCFS